MRSKTFSQSGLTALRRSVWFQPIALFLAILLAPLSVWLDTNPIYASLSPLAVQAQTVGGFCSALPTETRIIREYCVNNASYAPDLFQFEQDSLTGWLATHNMPASEATNFYTYARPSDRNEVRSYMLARILQIASKPASSRTANEAKVYEWMQALVRANEVKLYQNANSHFTSLVNDPCRFRLDSTIATSMKISFDGTPFCFNSFSNVFDTSIYVPSPSYFLQYGITKSYGEKSDLYPEYNADVADSLATLGPIIGISAAAGTVVAAGVGSAIAATILLGSLSTSATFGAFIVSTATIASLSTAALILAPVIFVFLCVLIGVVAAVQVFNNQALLNDLASLQTSLNNAISNPVSLDSLVADPSGNGAFKVGSTFVSQTKPEPTVTPAALPAHRPGIDVNFLITSQSGAINTAASFTYKDWKGDTRTTQPWNKWFVESCTGGSCGSSTSFNASLRYRDWNGEQWLGMRYGNRFLNARSNRGNLPDCIASATTGLSTQTADSCASYVSDSIPVTDASGNKVRLSLTTFRAPVVTNTNWTFSPGFSGTQTAQVSANPTARICLLAGALSSRFTYPTACYDGDSISASFNGNATEPTGLYRLDYSVTNSVGTSNVSINVGIGTATKIITPGNITVNHGQPTSITLVAQGVPKPQLSIDPGVNLWGLTFTNNGNGTATLSGIPRGTGISLVCETGDCPRLRATNGFTSDSQIFNVNVNPPPAAQAVGPFTATFTAGVNNQLPLVSFGATTPVTWEAPFIALPSWLRLTNRPDGTALLEGTPPLGTASPINLSLAPRAEGAIALSDTYTINISNLPAFTSGPVADFVVGSLGEFTVTATFGTLSLDTALPFGLFNAAPRTAPASGVSRAVFGVPAPGTGGTYEMRWRASTFTDSSTQNIQLRIFERPRFITPPFVTLFAGRPASFNVDTTGFPLVSTTNTGLNVAPSSPTQGLGVFFSQTGLPSSLTASNRNPAGFATGQLTITGTPTTADIGTRNVSITSNNGVGAPVTTNLTLRVLAYNPTQPVSLLPGFLPTRDSAGNVVMTVVLANNGTSAASNVAITSARLDGIAPTSITPAQQATIPAAGTATFLLTFPPTSGQRVFTLSGTHSTGTFNLSGRTLIP